LAGFPDSPHAARATAHTNPTTATLDAALMFTSSELAGWGRSFSEMLSLPEAWRDWACFAPVHARQAESTRGKGNAGGAGNRGADLALVRRDTSEEKAERRFGQCFIPADTRRDSRRGSSGPPPLWAPAVVQTTSGLARRRRRRGTRRRTP